MSTTTDLTRPNSKWQNIRHLAIFEHFKFELRIDVPSLLAFNHRLEVTFVDDKRAQDTSQVRLRLPQAFRNVDTAEFAFIFDELNGLEDVKRECRSVRHDRTLSLMC